MAADLADAAELGSASFGEFLRHRLVFANSEHLSPDIDSYYDSLPAPEGGGGTISDKEGLRRAGLGVYLFCHYAERWGSTRDAPSGDCADTLLCDPRDRANTLLGDPHVRSLLFDLYEVDEEFRQDQLTLHKVGTTSFILKMSSTSAAYALKIIKPWYFDDDVIAQQTRDYKNAYGYLESVIPGHFANIHTSNRSCIVMDFIEGITLRELFQSAEFAAVSRPNTSRAGNSLVSVMTDLCSLLSRCSSYDRPTFHGDLSTTNILVQPPSMKMYLIDFGTNYLLTRPVGTAEERSKVSYLMSNGVEERVASGDLFRVGIILAEGLLGQEFANERAPAIVDHIYSRYPSIGFFMDTLFLHASRSQTTAEDGGTFTYRALSEDLEKEFAALANAEAEREQRKLGIVDDLSLLVSPINLTQTFGFFQDVFNKIARGGTRSTGTGIQLRNLTWVPLLLNYFVIGAFFLTVARHLNGSPWPDDSAWTGSLKDSMIAIARHLKGSLWPNIIGWAGSLTYSIIAARYCVFVFRDLDLSDWPGWPRRSVPVTCILIWPAILTPLLIEWRWWAFCVAIGTAIIAVNNEVCVRSCETMLQVIINPADHGLTASRTMTDRIAPSRSSGIAGLIQRCLMRVGLRVPRLASRRSALLRTAESRLMARAFDYLIDWRQLMGIFSAGVFILAILIWQNVVQDALFYGVIVAVAPALKMYLQQTGTEAPIVHAGLHRTANAYRQVIAAGKVSAPKGEHFHTTAPPESRLERVDSVMGES
jgi:serine/threonine protein kinase